MCLPAFSSHAANFLQNDTTRWQTVVPFLRPLATVLPVVVMFKRSLLTNISIDPVIGAATSKQQRIREYDSQTGGLYKPFNEFQNSQRFWMELAVEHPVACKHDCHSGDVIPNLLSEELPIYSHGKPITCCNVRSLTQYQRNALLMKIAKKNNKIAREY
jgi:hypothetical protein